jgi:hypothetical protein
MPPLPGVKAQQQPTIPHASQQPGTPGEPDNGMGIPPEMQKRMQKKANEQRQADLKKDTEKLVKLSMELKQYVDKTNENVLSLDVIKKAEEIEKLAHNVRTKMRGTEYGGN